MKHFLLLTLIIPIQLFGQVHLNGILKDSKTLEPVEYASVYINGTTNGVITNQEGKFSLDIFEIPCKIIISHISYNTLSFEFTDISKVDTILYINLKDVEIQEISLSKKSRRAKNLKLFKINFLGNDRWGRKAIIENEDALQFEWVYDTLKQNIHSQKPSLIQYKDVLNYIDRKILSSKNDSAKSYLIPKKFIVTTSEPLKIQLPLLGYYLQYDLQKFDMTLDYINDFIRWKYKGYSYFQTTETESKLSADQISTNRKEAYYNSPSHFNKSFYTNTLRKSGYIVSELTYDSMHDEMYPKEVVLDSNWVYLENELLITGYKDREFYINYFPDFKGLPIDMSLPKTRNSITSKIKFLSDTCIIKSDGTNPDNSILYLPFIGTKQIGATLPVDYSPIDDQ